ncbi:MAG: hypothetical protein ACFFAJ_11925, partial [Candidatus Hodarchaeota archaeon]
VFDDTCYFIGLNSYEEAIILNTILNHPIAFDFYNSVIFWDSKRPITKQNLQQLDFVKFIQEIGHNELLELVLQTDPNVNSDIISSELQKMA